MASRRRVLEQQAARIETVLARHKVKVSVTGGIVTPRSVRFTVKPESTRRAPELDRLTGELAVALGAPEARVLHKGDTVQVEVPRAEAAAVRLLPLAGQVQFMPECTALLGVDSEGAPLLVRLPSSEVAHLLIGGATGCGKSALARTVLVSLAMFQGERDLNIVLIDPKERGLAPLAGLPHVLGDVAAAPDAISDCLRWLASELERREKAHVDAPRLVVAVDELADVFAQCGQTASSVVARLAQRGRETGIHLVICTQEPSAEWIGGALAGAFPVRAVGYTANRDEARNGTGLDDGAADRLHTRGEFLLVTRGDTIRFQAAWVGRSDLKRIQSSLNQAGDKGVRWAAIDAAAGVPFDIQHQCEKADPAFALVPKSRTSLWQRLRRAHRR